MILRQVIWKRYGQFSVSRAQISQSTLLYPHRRRKGLNIGGGGGGGEGVARFRILGAKGGGAKFSLAVN